MRGIPWPYNGIPKEQVIGTSFRYRWNDTGRDLAPQPGDADHVELVEVRAEDGQELHTLEQRDSRIDHINDKEGKPVGIQLHIGRRPVFACGNEGGAGAMLEFCKGSTHPSYQLIVNHDDSAREYFYQEKDNASMGAAARNGWQVVSMKNDWTQIFPAK